MTCYRTIVADPGTPIIIRWLFGDEAYGRSDAIYGATLNCVDANGTCTFTRAHDGFIGVAGSGAWVVDDG